MRRKEWMAWVGLALLFELRPSSPLLAEAFSVVHTEAPVFTEVAQKARLSGTALVRVRIDSAGAVFSSTVEKDLPMGLDRSAAEAALRWKFTPGRPGEVREVLLSFVFEHGETTEPSSVRASLDGPFTLRVVFEHSTVLWLPRENGQIPDKVCPVHGTVMAVEQVDISGGLPSGRVVDDTLEGRQREAESEAYGKALEEAEKELFPESHWTYGVGCIFPFEKKAEVYYCQACRDAETSWRESHPEPHR